MRLALVSLLLLTGADAMADTSSILAQMLESGQIAPASASGSWEAPSGWGGYLTRMREGLREKGLAMTEQGRKPAAEQASDFVYHLPVVGSARRAYDAHNEGHNGLATAGYSALAGLEALPFVAPAARGLTGAINGMRPGVVGTTTKGATAQYMGGSGVRSTMPEDMDAGLRTFVEGTRAFPQAQAAFQQAQRDYPAQIARAIALEKEMGTPTTGRGMARNRQLQAMVEERMPTPTAPRRPEEPGFVRGQDPDRMYGVMNQSPTLPAILAGMSLGATATGAPQEIADDMGHKAASKLYELAAREPQIEGRSPYRIDESPEAKNYRQEQAKRQARTVIGAGGAGLLGAATPIAAYGALQMMKHDPLMPLWLATENPVALGIVGAPVMTGYGAYKSGQFANRSLKEAAQYKHLLDANYRRDQPAMEQGPITDY